MPENKPGGERLSPREKEIQEAIRDLPRLLKELLGKTGERTFTEQGLEDKLRLRKSEGLVKHILQHFDAGRLPDGRIKISLKLKK